MVSYGNYLDTNTRDSLRNQYILLSYFVAEGSNKHVNPKQIRTGLGLSSQNGEQILAYLRDEGILKILQHDKIFLQHKGIKHAEELIRKSHFNDSLFSKLKETASKIKSENISAENETNVGINVVTNTKEEVVTDGEGNAVISVEPSPPNNNNEKHSASKHVETTSCIVPCTISDTVIPIHEDKLAHADYAEAIVDFLTHLKMQPPFSLVVDGKWGSGKSVLMQWVKEKLEKNNYTTVWFQAWKCLEQEAIWASFAREIIKATLTESIQKKIIKKRLKNLWKDYKKRYRLIFRWFLYVVFAYLLIRFLYLFFHPTKAVESLLSDTPIRWILSLSFSGFVIDIGLAFIKTLRNPLKSFADKFKGPDYDAKLGFQLQFREHMQLLIGEIVRDSQNPLVVFIDDLDRCPPPTAVEIFEAINILLDNQQCIFVMGLDVNTVAASIQTKYQAINDNLKSSNKVVALFSGKEFIEKFIQLTFSLPIPSETQILEYTKKLIDYPETDQIEKNHNNEINVQTESNSIYSQAKDKELIDVEDLAESSDVKESIIITLSYLPKNPRKVKRFINSFRLLAFIANRRGLLKNGQIDILSLAAFTAVVLEYHELLALIHTSEPQNKLFRLAQYYDDGDANHPNLFELYDLTADIYDNPRLKGLVISLSDIDNMESYLSLSEFIGEAN